MSHLTIGIAVLVLAQPAPSGPAPARDNAAAAPVLDADPCPTAAQPASPAVWGGAAYLLWWTKGQPVPWPLVTTGNPTDPVPGAPGQTGTQVLFGGPTVGNGGFSGVRATLGGWLGPDGRFGLEGTGFVLEQRGSRFAIASSPSGTPPLYLPNINENVFSANFGNPGSFTVADPLFPGGGPTSGAVAIATTTRLWGAEANGLLNMGRWENASLNVLVGFRYLDLKERLRLQGSTSEQGLGIQQSFHDDFSTRDQFYGSQLGARLSYGTGRFSANLTGKAALGATHQVVNTQGQSLFTGAGLPFPPGVYAGGVYAEPTNIGRRSANNFTVVPQVQCELGLDVTSWMRLKVGYDFLFWSSVVRPGNQIDPRINPSQVSGSPLIGPPLPAPQFNRSDFFAHGLSAGLQIQF